MVSILITAGPTREHLDDVRFLSNGSTGRMGFALATAAMQLGHEVRLVLGPVDAAPPAACKVRPVVSALEMQAAAEDWFADCQIAIAAAAVADWRPAHRAAGKPARHGAVRSESIELVQNPDIVAGLAAKKGPRVVVGFALESEAATMEQAIARGEDKLRRKQLDFCVCNRSDAIAKDASAMALVFADGRRVDLGVCDKAAAAKAIVSEAVQLYDRRRGNA
jgi:phosphopantothenoylcysteine decarboxylase/phosphopantothenate--cysteine ligase